MINYRSKLQGEARNLVNNLWYYSPIWFKFWVNNSIHKNCETIKKFTRLSRKIKWSNMRFWSAVLSTTCYSFFPCSIVNTELLQVLSSTFPQFQNSRNKVRLFFVIILDVKTEYFRIRSQDHYNLYKCSSPHKDLHLYFEANNHSKDAMGKHHTTNCYPFHEFPW